MKEKLCFISFFMIGLFPLKLNAQAVWSPDLPVNITTFTEEEKIAQRERGDEFLRELNRMVIRPNEDKELILQEDCRFSGGGSFSVSSLKNAKITAAEGKNVTFWFDAPHIYGMQLNKCDNVTFENITFDCDPVPFTQGKVVSKISQNSVVLEPMQGYEELISNPNGTFIIFNPDGSFKLHQHRTCQITQGQDKSITLTNSNFDIAEVGDYISLPSRTGSMISLTDCEKIVFTDVNVYASGGMCCVANTGKGGHEFHNFIATRRPGTNRLYAFGADGFHMNELEKGPIIENSEMSYTADDLINFHGRFGWVSSALDNTGKNFRIICSAGAIKTDQEIDFWDNATQEYRGKATVRQINIVTDQQQIDEARQGAIEHLGGNIYDIQLDNEVTAGTASLIEHHANLCSGFVVKNCKLHNTFNRGFLINGANDGLIEGNEVWNVGSGQSFHMETWNYGEGQYIRNLTIQNNTFENAGSLWFGLVPPSGNISYGAYRTTPMKNIRIADNTITLYKGDVFGINVNYTDGLVIEGNKIIRDAEDWLIPPTDVNEVDGYGRSLSSAIFVSTCKNVSIQDNQIEDKTPNNLNKIGYGTLVSNLTINGAKQLNNIADILSGWLLDGVQGDLGWSYGYVSADVVRNNTYTPDDFILMTDKGSTGWLPEGLYSPSIGKQQATPGSERSAVVRWISTIDGTIKVKGRIAPNGSDNGDKVDCFFFVNGEKKYSYDTANGATDLEIELGPVTKGSVIDFVLDSKGNTVGDQTFFNFQFLSDYDPGLSVNTPQINARYKVYGKNQTLYVELLTEETAFLSVYRIDGSLILSRNIGKNFTSNLNRGIYIIRINDTTMKLLMS